MGLFKRSLVWNLVFSLSIFSAASASADCAASDQACLNRQLMDVEESNTNAVLLMIGLVAGGLYFYTNHRTKKDDEETAQLISQFSRGEGLRLTRFDSPIDVSLMTSNERVVFNQDEGASVDLFALKPRHNKANIQVLKMSYQW